MTMCFSVYQRQVSTITLANDMSAPSAAGLSALGTAIIPRKQCFGV